MYVQNPRVCSVHPSNRASKQSTRLSAINECTDQPYPIPLTLIPNWARKNMYVDRPRHNLEHTNYIKNTQTISRTHKLYIHRTHKLYLERTHKQHEQTDNVVHERTNYPCSFPPFWRKLNFTNYVLKSLKTVLVLSLALAVYLYIYLVLQLSIYLVIYIFILVL